MMNYIWASIMIISVVCALITGKTSDLSSAVLSGANDAVIFIISILGMMALWTGIMKIAEKSGITDFLAKIFSPLIKFLFPSYPPGSDASKAICMNITANFLGLGNAATPFGIKAMKEMQKHNSTPSIANNEMVMFVVINTASLQLIPTFLCTLRQKHGAENPLDIIVCLWITSLVALTVGIFTAKFFEKAEKNRDE